MVPEDISFILGIRSRPRMPCIVREGLSAEDRYTEHRS